MLQRVINHYCIITVSKTIILARIFFLWYLANAIVLQCKEEKESSGRKKFWCGFKEDIIILRGKKKLHLDGRKALWAHPTLGCTCLSLYCQSEVEDRRIRPPTLSPFLLWTLPSHRDLCEVSATKVVDDQRKGNYAREGFSFPWILPLIRKHLMRNATQMSL